MCGQMNLQIDIGNTLLKWRIVNSGEVISRGKEPATPFFTMTAVKDWNKINAVAIASVASEAVEGQLKKILAEKLPSIIPFYAESQAELRGIVNAYSKPSMLGVDRWLGVVAGYLKYKEACYIVDCGSAITVDVVDGAGLHKGGYIIPGISLMRESLIAGTEQVEFEDRIGEGNKFGVSTTECVQEGVSFVLRSVLETLKGRMSGEGVGRLIVTGGDGEYLASLVQGVEYCPDLVFDGLALAEKCKDESF